MEKGSRGLGGIAGGFLGAVVYAIGHLSIEGVTISGMMSIVMLFLRGVVVGLVLGAVLPKPFTWLAAMIVDMCP
jgi:VIT1/CCC1 family predicted Fe2+/Mn2+ transporter